MCTFHLNKMVYMINYHYSVEITYLHTINAFYEGLPVSREFPGILGNVSKIPGI